MITVKVFKSGRSLAVEIPEKYRFKSSEVNVTSTADGLLLTEKDPWAIFEEGLAEVSDDYMAHRSQPDLLKLDAEERKVNA